MAKVTKNKKPNLVLGRVFDQRDRPLANLIVQVFDRDIIRDRTKAGLAAARKRGNTGGRPKKMDDKKIALAKTLIADKSNSINEICVLLKVSKATLYRYLKKE